MCTGIRLIADNGAVIYARTLEFGQPMKSDILVIPRNYSFVGTAPSGKPEGLLWKSRYAVVGANALGLRHILDGVNEAGLAGGLFYFPDFAQYQDVALNEYKNSLAPWELMTWLMTNYSTIDEVKKAITTIKVGNTNFKAWGFVPPVHAIVHDARGKSLVIEYVKGNLDVYDNPLGVVTNSPTFEWHTINLDNYVTLKAVNSSALILRNGVEIIPLGQGSGMLGLPGDFTPPSRFVRAVAFSQSVKIGVHEGDALSAAFHLLNLFNIPIGVVRHREKGKEFYDYTQWTSASDLRNKRYYFHTYESPQIQSVDLMNFDLDAHEPVFISMERRDEKEK